jgi:hypothetical protein
MARQLKVCIIIDMTDQIANDKGSKHFSDYRPSSKHCSDYKSIITLGIGLSSTYFLAH